MTPFQFTEATQREIAALAANEGCTVEQWMDRFVLDIVQNAAGIDLSKSPERIEARLTELEQDAADAIAAREQASEKPAQDVD